MAGSCYEHRTYYGSYNRHYCAGYYYSGYCYYN